MNGCQLNLNDAIFSEIATKLSRNLSVKKLSLHNNLCTISRETFRTVLTDSKSLEELRLDVPNSYLFADEEPTSEWTIDCLL